MRDLLYFVLHFVLQDKYRNSKFPLIKLQNLSLHESILMRCLIPNILCCVSQIHCNLMNNERRKAKKTKFQTSAVSH